MKELSQHKLKFNPYLEDLYQSDKPIIIYKVDGGYNIYTDFSKKIILTKKNIHKFLKSIEKKKFKKETDLYLGFFGYEILCNLIGINLKRKKRINFYKGIFYKPEKKISLSNNFKYENKDKHKNSTFKININKNSYTKIFNKFKKKIKSGETYQIKICTKYKTKSKIDPLSFFSKLSKAYLIDTDPLKKG